MTSYSVVIPALNEEGAIVGTLQRLLALQPVPEVIVVNDGSSDATASYATKNGAKVLSHPTPAGYGRSLKDGIRAASNDIVVITDADGTYPVERIPELVHSVERGFDMCVGARQGKHYRGSFFKMPARLVFKWLVEFTTGRVIPDINSGLRAFRKKDALSLESDLCNAFSYTTTITLIYFLTGRFIQYIPIEYGARVGKSKVRIVRDSLRTLQYIIEVIALYNPLKLFILLTGFSVFFSVIFFVEGLYFLQPFFLFLSVLFLLSSLLIFGGGIIAHILSSKRRHHS